MENVLTTKAEVIAKELKHHAKMLQHYADIKKDFDGNTSEMVREITEKYSQHHTIIIDILKNA